MIARGARTVGAAVHGPGLLDAVTDDSAPTMLAGRGKRVDRALEAVKHMLATIEHDRERLVVSITADFAHRGLLLRHLCKPFLGLRHKRSPPFASTRNRAHL